MIGEINVDSLEFRAPEKKEYFMKNMNVRATRQDNENQLKLTSEFLTANIAGKFQYHTLPASILQYHASVCAVFDIASEETDRDEQ